jgi:2-iminoacetate synthase ThiH
VEAEKRKECEMKKQMGRPNGHSPKNPGIAAMAVAISAKKAERKHINEELRELQGQLRAFRNVIVKRRRPKRGKKASAPKSRRVVKSRTEK